MKLRPFAVAFITAFILGIALFVTRVPAGASEVNRVIELPKTVTICHKNPNGYVKLTVSYRAWLIAFSKHEGDFILEKGEVCPKPTATPTATPTVDPTATPSATLTVTPTSTPEPTSQPNTTVNNTNNNIVNPATGTEPTTVTVPQQAPATGRG